TRTLVSTTNIIAGLPWRRTMRRDRRYRPGDRRSETWGEAEAFWSATYGCHSETEDAAQPQPIRTLFFAGVRLPGGVAPSRCPRCSELFSYGKPYRLYGCMSTPCGCPSRVG